jgi:hypothetical protein
LDVRCSKGRRYSKWQEDDQLQTAFQKTNRTPQEILRKYRDRIDPSISERCDWPRSDEKETSQKNDSICQSRVPLVEMICAPTARGAGCETSTTGCQVRVVAKSMINYKREQMADLVVSDAGCCQRKSTRACVFGARQPKAPLPDGASDLECGALLNLSDD